MTSYRDNGTSGENDIRRMNVAELAALGGGKVAYVKPMLSDEVQRLYPGVPAIPPGLPLFALLAADGSPIMLTDSRDTAIANAMEHDLTTLSLH